MISFVSLLKKHVANELHDIRFVAFCKNKKHDANDLRDIRRVSRFFEEKEKPVAHEMRDIRLVLLQYCSYISRTSCVTIDVCHYFQKRNMLRRNCATVYRVRLRRAFFVWSYLRQLVKLSFLLRVSCPACSYQNPV